jgi:trigger factor
MELKIQREEPSQTVRKLTITVPAQVISARLSKNFIDAQKKAKVKGFREGHVPMSMVQKVYGADVKHRVFHQIVDESFQEAVRKEEIRPVSRPQIDFGVGKSEHDHSTHSLVDGQELTFTATVEVLPEIEVKDYSGLKLTRQKVDVKDEDVEELISRIRDAHAQLAPVSKEGDDARSRPAQNGDFADIEFKGGVVTADGVEEREGMSGSHTLELGSQSFIPGFEEEIVGLRTGDEKTFRVTFPQEYGAPDLAGKEAEFNVKVNELKTKDLPELTDEFAKEAGYDGGMQDIRQKAKESLVKTRTEDADYQLKSDLIEQLIKKNKFEVPRALVQAQMQTLAQQFAQDLRQRGLNDEMIQRAIQKEEKTIRDKAENQVQAGLILDTIAKKEDIKVTQKDVDEELKTMAKSMNMEESKVRDYYTQDPKRLENLEFRIKEDKTIKLLLDQANVK